MIKCKQGAGYSTEKQLKLGLLKKCHDPPVREAMRMKPKSQTSLSPMEAPSDSGPLHLIVA